MSPSSPRDRRTWLSVSISHFNHSFVAPKAARQDDRLQLYHNLPLPSHFFTPLPNDARIFEHCLHLAIPKSCKNILVRGYFTELK